MMIVMKPTATEAQIEAGDEPHHSVGAVAPPSRGEEITVIGAMGDREHVARLELEGYPGVEKLVPILKPYKLASKQLRDVSVFEIGGPRIGGEHFSLVAGPCTGGTPDPTPPTARAGQDARAAPLPRGGAQPAP